MSNTWKIYMLAVVSFPVGTSEFIIAGILDKNAKDSGVSVSAAGQLITVFSLAYCRSVTWIISLPIPTEGGRTILQKVGA
jgi:DHA1 family putative efflux transporter-like MFS transporter